MKNHKGQVTVNAKLAPYLAERLNNLPSARQRADFIWQAADRFCMLEKLGLIGMNKAAAVGNQHPENYAIEPGGTDQTAGESIGGEFFDAILSGYMSE